MPTQCITSSNSNPENAKQKLQQTTSFFNFYFYLPKKIRLDFFHLNPLLHLKHQVLVSLKNNEKLFMNAVCCSRDWRFKGYFIDLTIIKIFSEFNVKNDYFTKNDDTTFNMLY